MNIPSLTLPTRREWVLLAALVILAFCLFSQCQRPEPQVAMGGLKDDGKKVSAPTLTDKDLAKLELSLKKYIDGKTLSATNLVREIRIDTTGKPFVLPDREPYVIELPDGTREIHHYPTYRKDFVNQWFTANIQADTQAVRLQLSVKDSFTVRHQLHRTGFLGLGKETLETEVFNHNPYAQTRGLRSFLQGVKRRRFGLGFGIYAGVSQNLKPAFFVGAGLQYSLVQF